VSDSLTWAVKHGDLVALRNALQSAPDLDGVDSQGWSPLFHAAHRGNAEAIRLLIGAGADVNLGHETGFTALFSAVSNGHVEAVRALLDAGAKEAPVQGIALRSYCHSENSERNKTILAMLDGCHTDTAPPHP
jgi:ankyrin repeat protein